MGDDQSEKWARSALPKWLYPTRPGNIVAIKVMLLVGSLAALQIAMFPTGVAHVDREPAWKLWLSEAIGLAFLFLSFPVGTVADNWFGHMHETSLLAVVFVPLNAYFWALVINLQDRWRRDAQDSFMDALQSKREDRQSNATSQVADE